MNRLVLIFILLPALALLSVLGALFLFAPEGIAGLAANSVDVQVVEPWRVGMVLLLCALPLLAATLYMVRAGLRDRQFTQHNSI
jgi:hypothetical protein